jgi:phosphatidylglycerol:prolipoprotein diacylglycerol transferase
LLDPGAFGLFIAQSIGRWGNFFNREAFGVETTMPWAMGLETARGTIYVHPTFLYESLWNMCGFIFLHIFSKKVGRKYYGHYALIYIAWYGLGRFFIEGLRVDSLFIPGTAIRVSQMVAIVSFVAALIALIRNHVRGLNNIQPYEEPVDVEGPEIAEEAKETVDVEETVDAEEADATKDVKNEEDSEEAEEVVEAEEAEYTEENKETERNEE